MSRCACQWGGRRELRRIGPAPERTRPAPRAPQLPAAPNPARGWPRTPASGIVFDRRQRRLAHYNMCRQAGFGHLEPQVTAGLTGKAHFCSSEPAEVTSAQRRGPKRMGKGTCTESFKPCFASVPRVGDLFLSGEGECVGGSEHSVTEVGRHLIAAGVDAEAFIAPSPNLERLPSLAFLLRAESKPLPVSPEAQETGERLQVEPAGGCAITFLSLLVIFIPGETWSSMLGGLHPGIEIGGDTGG